MTINKNDKAQPLDMILIITAISYVIAFLFMMQLRQTPLFHALSGKSYVMYLWAERLATGQIPAGALYYGPPLQLWYMSSLFALFGANMGLIRLVGSLLTALACILTWDLGRRLGGDRVGMIAGTALALYGPLHYYEAILPGTALTICLVLGGIICLIRAIQDHHLFWWPATGVLISIAALSRPNLHLIIPVAAVWAYFRAGGLLKRRAIIILLLITAWAVVIVGATALETTLYGRPSSTPTWGISLYLGNGPEASVGYGNVSFVRATMLGGDVQSFINEASARLGQSVDAAVASRYWAGQALVYMLSEPWQTIRHFATKTVLFFSPSEIPDNWDYDFWKDRLPVLQYMLTFHHVLPAALLGLIFGLTIRRRSTGLTVLLFAAYVMSTVLTLVLSRYRIILMPIILVWAATAVDSIASSVQRRPLYAVTAFMATALLIICLTLLPPPYDPDLTRSNAYVDMGVVWEQLGRTDLAIASYETAISNHPQQYAARIYAGNLLARQGDSSSALEHFLIVHAAGELVAAELVVLAELQCHTGKLEAALETLHAVLRRWPDYSPAYYMLARCQSHLGNEDHAALTRNEAAINDRHRR